MAGMVDGSNKFWVQTVSKSGGLSIQGYESKEHIAKEMIRQTITDWRDGKGFNGDKVVELKQYINKVVSDIEKELEEEKLQDNEIP